MMLSHTTAFVTTRLSNLYGPDHRQMTIKDVRDWLAEVDLLGVPDDTVLDECLLSVDIVTDAACDVILCGNAHKDAGDRNDLLVDLHDCDDPGLE